MSALNFVQGAKLIASRIAQVGDIDLDARRLTKTRDPSQAAPPAAKPAAYHASTCSGRSAEKPKVPPLAPVAASPLIGLVSMKEPPPAKYLTRPLASSGDSRCWRSPSPVRLCVKTSWPSACNEVLTRFQHHPPCQAPETQRDVAILSPYDNWLVHSGGRLVIDMRPVSSRKLIRTSRFRRDARASRQIVACGSAPTHRRGSAQRTRSGSSSRWSAGGRVRRRMAAIALAGRSA